MAYGDLVFNIIVFSVSLTECIIPVPHCPVDRMNLRHDPSHFNSCCGVFQRASPLVRHERLPSFCYLSNPLALTNLAI